MLDKRPREEDNSELSQKRQRLGTETIALEPGCYFQKPFVRDGPPLSPEDLKTPGPRPPTPEGCWLGRAHFNMVKSGQYLLPFVIRSSLTYFRRRNRN